MSVELARGALLGRYVVLDPLGAGGMSVVYAAYDPKLDRKVALKLLRPRSEGGDRQLRLEREAQAMARLSHPNVLPVHDVGKHGDDVFLAMDFVEGQTLTGWLAGGPRPWREVVAVFRDAGRGLAAAHDAGLIHRDFKPDNVLLRADGHVFVTDFGLARAAGDVGGDHGPSPGISPLAQPLTETGVVMGTPAYMAPEQHRGQPADERSDQFSFCVALYEGLFAQPAFAAPSDSELGMADALALEVIHGRVRSPPRSEVPPSVQRAVQRGLRPDPAERFPSMRALLEALAADPAGPRRRALFVAGALVVVAALAVAMRWRLAPAAGPVCAGISEKLIGAWDPEVRQAVDHAFLAIGRAYVPETLRRTVRALDEYATTWTAARTDACEDTAVRHEQSEALLDLRMICLDRRLDALRGLTAVFVEADRPVVERAVQAVLDLPRIGTCSDAAMLTAAVPPPADPLTRLRVTTLRARLEGARALFRAGKFDRAVKAATPLVEEARTIPYLPVQAEALEVLAIARENTGDLVAAEGAITEGLKVAADAGDRDRVALLAVELIYVVGVKGSRQAEGLALARLADVLVRQATDGGDSQYRLLTNVGNILSTEGKYDEALARFREAIAMRAPKVGMAHPQIARAYNSIGNILVEQGRYAEAREQFEKGAAIMEATLGPLHPNYGALLNGLGNVALYQQKPEDALAYYQHALTIFESAYGPDDSLTGAVVGNVGLMLQELGRFAEARQAVERQLKIRVGSLGPEHAEVAQTLGNLAVLLAEGGDLVQAEQLGRQALAMRERAEGKDHPDVAYPLLDLAGILLDKGDPGEACPLADRALALRRAKLTAGMPPIAVAMAWVAECRLVRGAPAEALALAEEALPILEKGSGGSDVGRLRFVLARALVALGRDRARALAAARQGLEDSRGPTHWRTRQAIETWLAQRR